MISDNKRGADRFDRIHCVYVYAYMYAVCDKNLVLKAFFRSIANDPYDDHQVAIKVARDYLNAIDPE